MRVGIVQPRIYADQGRSLEENDLRNYRHCLSLMGRFRKGGADIIVLPELYPGLMTLNVEKMRELREEAKRLSAFIVAGEIYKEGGRKHNAATIVSPTGKIMGRHFKMQLWGGEEKSGVKGGRRLRTFKINGIKTGVLICSDFYGGHLAQRLVDRGAELLIIPSMASPTYERWWAHDLLYVSHRLRVPIVYVNC